MFITWPKVTRILRGQKAFLRNFSLPRKVYHNYCMWVFLILFCCFPLIVSYIVWNLLFFKKLYFTSKLVEKHNDHVFSSGICNSTQSLFCIMTSSKYKPSQTEARYLPDKNLSWRKTWGKFKAMLFLKIDVHQYIDSLRQENFAFIVTEKNYNIMF